MGLKELPEAALAYASVDIKKRLVRATLASLKNLVFRHCFVDNETCGHLADVFRSERILVPQLQSICFDGVLDDDGGATQIFQSMGCQSKDI